MRRLIVSHVSRWPPAKRRNYKTYIVKLIVMFPAPALKWYVTSNTQDPRWKSFHLEIWDISLLYTHFSLLFLALGSESHLFCLLGVGKFLNAMEKVRTHTSKKQTTILLNTIKFNCCINNLSLLHFSYRPLLTPDNSHSCQLQPRANSKMYALFRLFRLCFVRSDLQSRCITPFSLDISTITLNVINMFTVQLKLFFSLMSGHLL